MSIPTRVISWRSLLGVLLTAAASVGCGPTGPPYSANDALGTFEIEAGFQIELFAHEPDITDPVAMEFDEYGRIYVVESPGYPLETGEPLGRVKLLEDTDGDGLPDRSTLFADQLTMPTGVMRWKDGILVTDAPNIWYFEDTDQDGRADERRVVLTGFAFTNPQHTVNTPIYGLDNWIYLAQERPIDAKVFVEKFGDRGTPIRFPDREDVPAVDPQERNLRFRPDTYELEVLAGVSQFGQTFDAWGRHFGVQNPITGRHEVIAARYLERNPDLPVSSAMQELSEDRHVAFITERPESPRESWGFGGSGGFGRLTSACGITCYLGGAFPEKYRNIAFIAEPAHNSVLAHIWSPAGASFQARRLNPEREFLASRDGWSRPVNFYVGPEGALYVVDYYRRIIEHPEWTSREVYESDAIYDGNDKGRIYRITPTNSPPPLPTGIRLGDASAEELVEQLGSPNLWRRRTAQRLLLDRAGEDSVAALRALAENSALPLGRLHALWTLEGLGKLEANLVAKTLDAGEAGLRENAILLAERRVADSPSLTKKLIAMRDDPDPRVRFQLLCTLGDLDSEAARVARDKLLARDIDDRWVRVAALSASSDDAPRLFEMAVSTLGDSAGEAKADFVRQAGSVIGSRGKNREIRRVLGAVERAADRKQGEGEGARWRTAGLEGLAEGLRAAGDGADALTAGQKRLLLRLFETQADLRRASLELLAVVGLPSGAAATAALERAARLAADGQAASEQRVDAIGLLALGDPAPREALFKKLVDPREPQPVQVAAVGALGGVKGAGVGSFLLQGWRAMTSEVRAKAVEVLGDDPQRIRLLLDAIREGDVQPWSVSSSGKWRLLTHPDESLRAEAEKLIRAEPGERERVVERYDQAAAMEGDPERGREVFERVCAKCHTMNGVGKEVGPDLGEVRNRPAELLLADILMPNQSIAQQYESYIVELTSGETIDGVMGSQTPTSITIRQEEGKEHVIRRSNIRNLYIAELSAMPEDVEEQVDVQQMADLLRFIKNGR